MTGRDNRIEMGLYINDELRRCGSLEEFDACVDSVQQLKSLDLTIFVKDGPSLHLLRAYGNAFLMYLRKPGDSGFVSGHAAPATPTADFRLGNGQIDEYPVAWCIPPEDCFKAIKFFYVNNGLQPESISWHES